jgi:hypothetical protein
MRRVGSMVTHYDGAEIQELVSSGQELPGKRWSEPGQCAEAGTRPTSSPRRQRSGREGARCDSTGRPDSQSTATN